MKTFRLAFALATMMGCMSVAAPLARAVKTPTAPRLEQNIPERFGGWTRLADPVQVADPLTLKTLGDIYGETLSHSYANKDGYRIMLSMAWGGDQRGALQAHKPDVCYPAQGFKILARQDSELQTDFGAIEAVRLSTSLGSRHEPVTYWLTNGNQVVRSKWEQRIVEIKKWLTGEIPDGVLYRVSSIDTDTAGAYAMQERFTADLIASVTPAFRKRISGLGPAVPPSSGG